MNLLFGFSGRITRSQWWLAQIPYVILVAWMLLPYYNFPLTIGIAVWLNTIFFGLPVTLIASLIVVWICTASCVKRLHDRNKSGLWALVAFIPFVGLIWSIIECGCLSGTDGDNDYGPGGSGGGTPNMDNFAAQLAAEYSAATKGAAEAPRAAGLAKVQAPSPAMPPRRSGPTGFGRRGTA